MEKVTEIIKTEVTGKYNNIHVVFQDYLVEGEDKTPLGGKRRETVACGDTAKLIDLGLDKYVVISELWPQALVDEYNSL